MREGEEREQLVAAARGDEPMDLVVRNANLVNVFTAEVYSADVGVKDGRFAAIVRRDDEGNPSFDLEGLREVPADGLYAVPGFFDCHVHIESTMVPPDEFAKAVLRHGTTACAIDPHEIANVLGKEGIRYMVEASRGLPLRVFTTVSSCVPAVPGLENAGAELGADDIDELLGLDGVVGVAELMDYPGVINLHPRMAAIARVGLERGVPNEGHAPGVRGRDLQAYLAAGVDSDHESREAEEILEKLRAGMLLYIRESSWSHSAAEAAKALKEVPHAANVAMCTDDTTPDDVLKSGHMNRAVRRCVEAGIPAALAVRYATLGGATRFGRPNLGAISPGRLADLVLVESLETMRVKDVYVEGRLVVEDGELAVPIKSETPPPLKNTVRLPELSEDDFAIHAPLESGEAKIAAIELEPSGTTKAGTIEVEVEDGRVRELPEGYVFISVTNRHGRDTKPVVGVLKGIELREGAHGSTVAHDNHNLIVAGTNAADMLLVARTLQECGGGFCLAKDGSVLAKVELPVAGLMSPKPVEDLAPQIERYNERAGELGISGEARAPMMVLSNLALTAKPEVRISDVGLVQVEEQRVTPLFD